MALRDLLKQNMAERNKGFDLFSTKTTTPSTLGTRTKKPRTINDIFANIEKPKPGVNFTAAGAEDLTRKSIPPAGAPSSIRTTERPVQAPLTVKKEFETPSGAVVGADGKVIKDTETKIFEEASPKEKLIERLLSAQEEAAGFDPVARFKELNKEAGIGQAREDVTSLQKTVSDVNTLLDNLEADIKERTGGFVVSEAQRRRILGAEAAPLLKGLGAAERGLATAQDILEARQSEVIQQLGLEELAANRPLSLLRGEIETTGDVNALFRVDETVIDKFTDENGNRIAIFQDGETGETKEVVLGQVGVDETEKRLRELEIQEKEIDIKRKLARGVAGGGLDPEDVGTALQISAKVTADPVFQDMTDISTGAIGVFQGLAQDNGFGDIAAINSFQRMIDPGATVRAEDVKLLQTANALFDQVSPEFQIKKLREGDKLPERTRERMRVLSAELYDVRRTNYLQLSGDKFRKISEAAGIPFEFTGADFGELESIIGATGLPEGREGGFSDEEADDIINQILEGVLEEEGTGFSFFN